MFTTTLVGFVVFGDILLVTIWDQCLARLQDELPSQQFNTWIRPLQAQLEGNAMELVAPNRFIKDWVGDKFLHRINELASEISNGQPLQISVVIGASSTTPSSFARTNMMGSTQTTNLNHSSHSNNTNSFNHSNGASRVNGMDSNTVTTSHSGTSIPLSNVGLSNSSAVVEPELVLDTTSTGAASTSDTHNNAYSVNEPSSIIVPNSSVDIRSDIDSSDLGKNTQHTQSKPRKVNVEGGVQHKTNLINSYVFDTFVEGKSNQLARAAATQVAENPGGSYNPLFLYGGVGLGKTHLMHAVGHEILKANPNAKVVYLHSERFVADMVKALQLNAINDFKRFYRSLDALLIDDIQFFAGKDRSQEELFHTFNALLEGGQQMILSCDRFPKEIQGLEERLKSRFGWGLSVSVEPPELETRVAILMKKAEQAKVLLPNDSAFFIAQRVRSNVRELEGALKRVIAHASFMNQPLSVDLVREALKDLLALQDRQVSIENIQKTVAEYFKIKVSDLLSKRRTRSVARPRQVAMSLAKELTNHSLPEIGDGFGGRDHTTVLHACRKIKELRETDKDIEEDYTILLRLLTT